MAMVTKKLVFDRDFYNEEVVLIALYSGIELYKIGYWINHFLKLNLHLERQEVEIIRKGIKSSYPLYFYRDDYQDLNFYLMGNKALLEREEFPQNELFFENYSTYFEYLIPERRDVDFFLKIEGTNSPEIWVTLLKKIKVLSAVFPVDMNVLKSYKNLIFE